MSDWPTPHDELGRLTAALCDEVLTPGEAQRLEQLVERSDAARRWFRNYVQLHAELYWEHAASLGPAKAESGKRKAEDGCASPARRFSTHGSRLWIFGGAAVAAVLLVAITWGPRFLGAGLGIFVGPAKVDHAVRDTLDRGLPSKIPAGPCVARLRAIVAADPRLRHHYPFEGTTPAARLRDRRGELDLIEVVMGGGRGAGSLQTAAPGWDGTTQAVAPYRLDNDWGMALQSQDEFTPPAELTIELLLCFRPVSPPTEKAVAAAVALRADARRSAFFLAAAEQGHAVHLFDGEAPWTETHFEFLSGEWYYVAGTFQSAGGQTRVSTYAANLTRGEKRLTAVLDRHVAPGAPAASCLGIGKGFNGFQAHAYPWSGSLDEVAIYEGVLPREALDEHLAAVVGQEIDKMPHPKGRGE